MNRRPKLILASRSPRRRELLAAAGYDFEVQGPDESAECGVCSGESPAEHVARLARQKAENVAHRLEAKGVRDAPASGESVDRRVIVACDTVAECQGQILGKPRDEAHARQMLALLSGREHRVLSGLCLWPLDGRPPRVEVDVTVLRMDVLSPERIQAYLEGGQWLGKAGAFGYQDGLDWVHVIAGSESNVVGLPIERLKRMLSDLGSGQGP
ncbi:MAG: septum formation protein Maf [Planctomycetia bacterium]|nr:septum formation protein Maf [Planctomycetia bacterium]